VSISVAPNDVTSLLTLTDEDSPEAVVVVDVAIVRNITPGIFACVASASAFIAADEFCPPLTLIKVFIAEAVCGVLDVIHCSPSVTKVFSHDWSQIVMTSV
jgi:hypothetical protein